MTPKQKYVLASVITIFAAGVEVVGWQKEESYGLLADAVHTFADMLSLWVGYLSAASNDGHTKDEHESLLARINYWYLLLGGLYLIAMGGWRLYQPVQIGKQMILFAAVGLVCNIAQFAVVVNVKDEHSKDTYRGQFWHFLTDLLASLAVVAVGGAILYFGPGWNWLDSMVTIAIGIFTCWMGATLNNGDSNHSHAGHKH